MSFSYHKTISDHSKKISIISSPGIYPGIVKTIDPGDIVLVDTDVAFYNWDDREYYRVKKPVKGWINTTAVGEVLHGKHFS